MYKSQLRILKNRYNLKIILHIGTPKTATTTLQHLLHSNRKFLLENGYCYPFSNENPPKHQWMVSSLKQYDSKTFLQNLEIAFTQTEEDTDTVILSSEGIFNHWYDFPQESKRFLNALQEVFDVEILLVLRDQVSFTKSYYKQVLKNPQIKNIDSYGKDISLSQLLKDKWFLKHLDYFSFVQSCKSIFTQSNIEIFKYENDIMERILKYLNLDIKIENVKSENVSLSTISCELLRVINRYNLSAIDKKEAIQCISTFDKVVTPYSKDDVLDETSVEYIKKLTLESNSKLGLRFF